MTPKHPRAPLHYLGALILIALLLVEPVWHAIDTGTVTVMRVRSLGTTFTEVVPWMQGWSRFVGPLLLLAALEIWRRWERFWTAVSITFSGAILTFLPFWFTSWERLAAFIGTTILLVSSLVIGRRFGWIGVFGFIGASLALAAWLQTSL